MKRNGRIWGVLLCGALLVCGWIVYGGAAGARDDAETMLRAADRLFPGEKTVTLRHGGAYREFAGAEQFARLGRQAASAFGLPEGAAAKDANGHLVYRAQAESAGSAGGRVEVALVGWENRSTYLTVRWDAPAGAGIDDVRRWRRSAEEKLRALGVRAEWTVTVRGDVGTLPDDRKERLWAEIRGEFRAEPAETYADASTESVSFRSPLLRGTAQSGGRTIQLQAALHRDSESGVYRLTLATPLIASES